MADSARIAFFLADRQHPVGPASPIWDRILPSAPDPGGGPAAPQNTLTYGQYFTAVADFLRHREWFPVRLDLGDAPQQVEIFLEKHGAFYHPARIAVATGSGRRDLAVNVAVSPAGRALLAGEASLLDSLERRFGGCRLPKVFHCRTVVLDGGRCVPMFLAEWFTGFFEFHLTACPDAKGRPAVWTPSGPRPLDAGQTRSLYREAAGLLTGYYDVLSTEQILDWHHAAGDFIVRPHDGGDMELRLITVRRYGPLIAGAEPEFDTVLLGAALFLVHTSLRMRLDRCDGIGETLLAGPETIAPVVEGFFDALAGKVRRGQIPDELASAVAVYLGGLTVEDLAPMISACIQKRPAGDPGRILMAAAAARHGIELQRVLEAGERHRSTTTFSGKTL